MLNYIKFLLLGIIKFVLLVPVFIFGGIYYVGKNDTDGFDDLLTKTFELGTKKKES